MAGRKPRESNLTLNMVIGGSVALFAFFYWREVARVGSKSAQRTPESCLETITSAWRTQGPSMILVKRNKPVPAPPTPLEIPIETNWDGLNAFFWSEDLEWLRSHANHISLGYALEMNKPRGEWEKWDAWDRMGYARNAVMDHIPKASFKVQPGAPASDDTADLIILEPDKQTLVSFVKEDGLWKVSGFFGGRGKWEAVMKELNKMLPDEMKLAELG